MCYPALTEMVGHHYAVWKRALMLSQVVSWTTALGGGGLGVKTGGPGAQRPRSWLAPPGLSFFLYTGDMMEGLGPSPWGGGTFLGKPGLRGSVTSAVGFREEIPSLHFLAGGVLCWQVG